MRILDKPIETGVTLEIGPAIPAWAKYYTVNEAGEVYVWESKPVKRTYTWGNPKTDWGYRGWLWTDGGQPGKRYQKVHPKVQVWYMKCHKIPEGGHVIP